MSRHTSMIIISPTINCFLFPGGHKIPSEVAWWVSVEAGGGLQCHLPTGSLTISTERLLVANPSSSPTSPYCPIVAIHPHYTSPYITIHPPAQQKHGVEPWEVVDDPQLAIVSINFNTQRSSQPPLQHKYCCCHLPLWFATLDESWSRFNVSFLFLSYPNHIT